MTFSNDSSNLSKVRAMVSVVLDETEFTRETRNKIIVAVDEALANVVEHAYQGGEGMIDIAFDLDPGIFGNHQERLPGLDPLAAIDMAFDDNPSDWRVESKGADAFRWCALGVRHD